MLLRVWLMASLDEAIALAGQPTLQDLQEIHKGFSAFILISESVWRAKGDNAS